MGFSRGTAPFDAVARVLVEDDPELYSDKSFRVLNELYDSLGDLDWDTEYESAYWEHPVIGRILGNDFEED